jgi:predicted nucleic acid-binding protein
MLFDTRYFWAIFSSKDEETTAKLKSLFDRSKSAYVSSITIYEVFKLTLASEDKTAARLRVSTIANEFEVIDVDPEIAEEGASISHRLRTPMADSLIMATAKQLHLSCVTDDPHFTEVKRIWI